MTSDNGNAPDEPKPGEPAEAGAGPAASDDGPPPPPPTPFDHPFFLPALFFAASIWFGYDGWINTDPEMVQHQGFNRYGFPVVAFGFCWFLYKGIGEWREDKERAAAGGSTPESGR